MPIATVIGRGMTECRGPRGPPGRWIWS